jgi:hypothetical protein
MVNNTMRRFTLGLSNLQISFDPKLQVQNNTVPDTEISFASQSIVIDSFTSYIWLPPDICALFERALGLNWDERSELYLVSDALHQNLNKTNPTVTFQLGGPVGSDNRTSVDQRRNFTMSYSSFDLSVSAPLVSTPNPTRYFPLKRIPSARSDQPWVLGRAFLQDTYLTARYDEQTFSLSQARFDKSIPPQIQTLDIPAADQPPPTTPASKNDHLRIDLVIIFVCVSFGLVGLMIGISYYCVWAYRNGKRPFNQAHSIRTRDSDADEPFTPERMEMDAFSEKPISELSSREILEVEGHSKPGELAEHVICPQELAGDSVQVHEMDAVSSVPKKPTSPLRNVAVAV